MCVARNLSGEAQSVCIVKFIAKAEEKQTPINEAPKFTTVLNDVTINDGQDLQ